MLFETIVIIGVTVAVIAARVAWLRWKRVLKRPVTQWHRSLRKWWNDPTFERDRGQLYFGYFEPVPPIPLNESLESQRLAFVAPDIAKYLSTFWNDPNVDPQALQAEVDKHFPLPVARTMNWVEWISWNWFPASRFSHIVRNEQVFYERTRKWRTQAMTPYGTNVNWNENILDVYRIPPDTDMTQVENYEKLQIHLSTMTALKDYYGDYSSFTDRHRWESRKLNTYVSLQANVHGDPVGNIMIWYDPLRRCFSYRGNTRHCQHFHYVALLALGLRYVLMFRCRDFFIDDKWFPHLRNGYRNNCRLYKDDSVTIVDKCIPVANHLRLTNDGTLNITPHEGDIRTLAQKHEAKLLESLKSNPALLDQCMEGEDATDGTLIHLQESASELTTYKRPPTNAEILYNRTRVEDYKAIIPRELHNCTVGRAYRPLPAVAKLSTEDRIIAFDNYHRDIVSKTERRLKDYDVRKEPAPSYAASSHTQVKKSRALKGGQHILSNQFERVELQPGQYEEFPVVTNPLAIGWRVHDPVFIKNMKILALTDTNTGKSKTLQVLRDAWNDAMRDLKRQSTHGNAVTTTDADETIQNVVIAVEDIPEATAEDDDEDSLIPRRFFEQDDRPPPRNTCRDEPVCVDGYFIPPGFFAVMDMSHQVSKTPPTKKLATSWLDECYAELSIPKDAFQRYNESIDFETKLRIRRKHFG